MCGLNFEEALKAHSTDKKSGCLRHFIQRFPALMFLM